MPADPCARVGRLRAREIADLRPQKPFPRSMPAREPSTSVTSQSYLFAAVSSLSGCSGRWTGAPEPGARSWEPGARPACTARSHAGARKPRVGPAPRLTSARATNFQPAAAGSMGQWRSLLGYAAVLLLLGHATAAPAGGRCFKKSNSSPIQTCEVTPCQGNGEGPSHTLTPTVLVPTVSPRAPRALTPTVACPQWRTSPALRPAAASPSASPTPPSSCGATA
jgi:hypothetical protein